MDTSNYFPDLTTPAKDHGRQRMAAPSTQPSNNQAASFRMTVETRMSVEKPFDNYRSV
jgi:hypothetical protein